MNIIEYGIVNWLVDYHFKAVLLLGAIMLIVLLKDFIIDLWRGMYD